MPRWSAGTGRSAAHAWTGTDRKAPARHRCNTPTCDLGAGVAESDQVHFTIMSTDGRSLDDVSVKAGDQQACCCATWSGVATLELHAELPGWCDVDLVHDSNGDLGVHVEFMVRAPDHLALVPASGVADGPTNEPGYDEAWTVHAGAMTSFVIEERAGTDTLVGLGEFMVFDDPGRIVGTGPASQVIWLSSAVPVGDYPITLADLGFATPQRHIVVHVVP